MIHTRTPLRLPLAGGLTDVKRYAAEFGGQTVSSTIQLGVDVRVGPSSSGAFEVLAEGVLARHARAADVEHDLVREALASVDPALPPLRIEIALEATGNSGLGASGAICVGLLNALRRLGGEWVEAAELAAQAADIEVEKLGGASGYHDPHICARGGLLAISYDGPSVTAVPIGMPDGFRQEFEGSLLMFATGVRASTKSSLTKLNDEFARSLPVLHEMRALALELRSAFADGDLQRVAWCVGEQQRLKERLPGDFRSELVESVRTRLEPLGAAAQFPGGKVGGYFHVCCPDGQHDAVRSRLAEFEEVELRLTHAGTTVVGR